MSYAQAKEIALLRLSLRACWAAGDRPGALALYAKLSAAATNENDQDLELAAEMRRWAAKLATA